MHYNIRRFVCLIVWSLIKTTAVTLYIWAVIIIIIFDIVGFSRFLYTYNTNGSDNSFDDIDDDDEFVGRLSAPYIMYGKSYQDVYVSMIQTS